MADDPNKRGPADQERINIHECFERQDWSKHFGVTEQQIIDCVKKVGVRVLATKKCLGK